jgi:hypothetical protein
MGKAQDNHGHASRDPNSNWGWGALKEARRRISQYYDDHAEKRLKYIENNRYFYGLIERIFAHFIAPDRRVLQLGCVNGFFLPAVRAKEGVCIDQSQRILDLYETKFPNYTYYCANEETLPELAPFDHIIITNNGDTVDIFDSLVELKKVTRPDTRLFIYNYNRQWEPLIKLAERLKLKFPQPERNWFSTTDIENLLRISGYEPVKTYRRVLVPYAIPLLASLANRFLAFLPLLNRICMISVIVARPTRPAISPSELSVSVIVPCKDEVGNVEMVVERIPDIGRHTEIVFCDDKSTDGTVDEIRRLQAVHPERDIKLLEGPGISKAKNVWTGFNGASGDVLIILDADLTVMPEKLTQFLAVLASGQAEFINGSRMIYPMQSDAMRTLNLIGNKFYSFIFRLILGQPIMDTLCGTKVLWRADWPEIRSMLDSWGAIDRWGDFELIFGAAKMHRKIVDLPVHYQDRIYGETKMTKRLHNALIMARICWTAFLRLKWI